MALMPLIALMLEARAYVLFLSAVISGAAAAASASAAAANSSSAAAASAILRLASSSASSACLSNSMASIRLRAASSSNAMASCSACSFLGLSGDDESMLDMRVRREEAARRTFFLGDSPSGCNNDPPAAAALELARVGRRRVGNSRVGLIIPPPSWDRVRTGLLRSGIPRSAKVGRFLPPPDFILVVAEGRWVLLRALVSSIKSVNVRLLSMRPNTLRAASFGAAASSFLSCAEDSPFCSSFWIFSSISSMEAADIPERLLGGRLFFH
mmetsp:Transcript_20387/g.49984  ORF Transcript_20387/g.49984 Transcript_20387/m.49984 type:complete len:269 (-) Transcript_20387:695-1501(-)